MLQANCAAHRAPAAAILHGHRPRVPSGGLADLFYLRRQRRDVLKKHTSGKRWRLAKVSKARKVESFKDISSKAPPAATYGEIAGGADTAGPLVSWASAGKVPGRGLLSACEVRNGSSCAAIFHLPDARFASASTQDSPPASSEGQFAPRRGPRAKKQLNIVDNSLLYFYHSSKACLPPRSPSRSHLGRHCRRAN